MSDERAKVLHDRLVTWWYGSFEEGTELREIWQDAFRRFDARLRQVLDDNPYAEDRILETSPDMLMECFEAALTDHDHILANFPHSLPEGWHEWQGD